MAREDSSRRADDQRRATRVLAALAPAILLFGTIGGIALAYAIVTAWGWEAFWIAIVAALVGPFLWVLVSALNPAAPDRRCPACGEVDALVRPSREHMLGIRCLYCGHADDEAYVAHLEEYLEDFRGPDGVVVAPPRPRPAEVPSDPANDRPDDAA